jgi:hypothetical protein
MQRRKIGMLVLGVLIIISAIFGWKEYTRKNEPVKNLKPAFEVSAPQIIKEFEINDSLPARKYLGKLIAVNGVIKTIDKDNHGFFTVVLGNAASMSSVRCAMDSLFASEVLSLKKDQTITIKGMFTGFQKDETGLLGSDIILNRCVIEKPQTNKQD